MADMKDKLFEVGAVASPMSPAEFVNFLEVERNKWAEVVKASGAKVNDIGRGRGKDPQRR